MLFLTSLFTLGSLFAAIVSANPIEKRTGPVCTEVKFTTSIHVLNKDLRLIDPFNIVGSLLNFLTTFDLSGTYEIAGRYCEPEVHVPSRYNTLQFLVHGGTYDRNYWSGLGAPGEGFHGDEYSCVNYASKEGYPTLAIDRLGSGASTKADPFLVVQMNAEMETAHKVIQQIRGIEAGTPLARNFNKIIYAGHSVGSILGNYLVAKYPADFDTILLTGYSNSAILDVAGTVLSAFLLPPQVVMPNNPKWNTLPFGYLQFSTRSGFDYLFYKNGAYDPALEAMDFAGRGTLTVGELFTIIADLNTTKTFSGPVYLVTAKNDQIFCQNDCGTSTSGKVFNTRKQYPAASAVDVYIVPNAGRCWHTHYTADAAFVNIHQWLAGKGF